MRLQCIKRAFRNGPFLFLCRGILPEWSKGADLRSARHTSLRGFRPHRYQTTTSSHRTIDTVISSLVGRRNDQCTLLLHVAILLYCQERSHHRIARDHRPAAWIEDAALTKPGQVNVIKVVRSFVRRVDDGLTRVRQTDNEDER